MKHFNILLVIISLSFFLNGCYKDKEELLYPENFIVESGQPYSYSEDVYPIFELHCLACHNTDNANSLGGNLSLSTYESTTTVLNNGALLSSVLQDGTASPMPKNSPPMSGSKITIIAGWINDGGANN